MTPLEQFVDLFRGRGDAYGSWEGGCVRQPLTVEVFRRHLEGEEKIGVYPIVPTADGDLCIWGCIDIDIDDLDGARNLQTILKARNIPTWVERTRKGYHVWCFTDSLMPAATMRRALLAAHQVLNYPAREVNPKQETLTSGQLGNYVRLPYYGKQDGVPPDRYMMDDNDTPLDLGQFLERVTKASRDDIESTAQLWVAPAQTTKLDGGESVWGTDTHDQVKGLMRSNAVDAATYSIWMHGANREPYDRSATLVRLARKLSEQGIPMEIAWPVLIDADRRWGKFHSRRDGEQQLQKILEHGYRPR